MSRPGGDNLPFVYSGTLVVQGRGIAQVQATGVRTEMGKIGKALQTAVTEETLLKKETRRLVRLFIVAILKPNRASSPGLLKILSSVRPCTDTFGRKALAFLAV
jgi:hypothetical protein